MVKIENQEWFCPVCVEHIKTKQEETFAWLAKQEGSNELPLYSSVDIRDAGFKIAVVDTNLFPAGFNNLCEHGLADSVGLMKNAIYRRVPGCKNVLIVAEEHTRNTWYLENVRILEEIIRKGGFRVKIATFLTDAGDVVCGQDGKNFIEFETAVNQKVRIYCFKQILADIEIGKENFDLIILNNDLLTGIPDVLKKTKIPIYPSMQAGWHSRLKSHHFTYTNNLVKEFAQLVGMDPWLFSCLFTAADKVDVNNDQDRVRIADLAADLFKKIEQKYKEHEIPQKPYLILKADAGTYGMAVMAFEDPKDLLDLNRKERNKLYKGKGAQVVERYLIQEGVPTIYYIDHQVSEVCIYQIENNLVGGFYRSHPEKGIRDNLNSKGMEFKKMCPHLRKYGDSDMHPDMNIFDVYRILARIAGIAAHREVVDLEAGKK